MARLRQELGELVHGWQGPLAGPAQHDHARHLGEGEVIALGIEEGTRCARRSIRRFDEQGGRPWNFPLPEGPTIRRFVVWGLRSSGLAVVPPRPEGQRRGRGPARARAGRGPVRRGAPRLNCDAGAVVAAGDEVGPFLSAGRALATATAHSHAVRKAWSFSASPTPTTLCGDRPSSRQRRRQARRLVDAGRQHHHRALVEDDLQLQAQVADRARARPSSCGRRWRRSMRPTRAGRHRARAAPRQQRRRGARPAGATRACRGCRPGRRSRRRWRRRWSQPVGRPAGDPRGGAP